MEFLKQHARVYLIISAALILTGAYPLWSLFFYDRNPCKPLILACRDQKILPPQVTDRREIHRRCIRPVMETQRLGNVYFDARAVEECRASFSRRREERAGAEPIANPRPPPDGLPEEGFEETVPED